MMYWGYDDGWSWLLVAATVALFWAGVAARVVPAARFVTRRAGADRAMALSRRRLASGEITREEFDKTRRVLRG